MPTISFFYGIRIEMFWNEHPPAHFHAKSGSRAMVVHMESLFVEHNDLPASKAKRVLQWADEHRTELREAWEAYRQQKVPSWIELLR